MTQKNCPVCNSDQANSKSFLKENYDKNRLSGFSFSSRKMPEYMNYELRKCNVCNLVYSIAPIQPTNLIEAYQAADYDSSSEANEAAETYIAELCKLIGDATDIHSALEIGAGNGAFLQSLKKIGVETVVGIEPSLKAIAAASSDCRDNLIAGEFKGKDFLPNSFDLICCFMTLEHVSHPKILVDEAFGLLKPGGYFVCVTHDYKSPINRIMGKRSPIIDIEHLQLFCKNSMEKLLSNSGFLNVKTSSFCNTYPLGYWFKLFPFPTFFKRFLIKSEFIKPLLDTPISINVGNQISIGQKVA